MLGAGPFRHSTLAHALLCAGCDSSAHLAYFAKTPQRVGEIREGLQEPTLQPIGRHIVVTGVHPLSHAGGRKLGTGEADKVESDEVTRADRVAQKVEFRPDRIREHRFGGERFPAFQQVRTRLVRPGNFDGGQADNC